MHVLRNADLVTSLRTAPTSRLSIADANYRDAQNVIAAHEHNEHPLTQIPGYATGSLSMFSSAMTSSNLVKYIFIGSSKLVYSSTGYNLLYGHEHLRYFSDNDYCTASIIRDWIVLSL